MKTFIALSTMLAILLAVACGSAPKTTLVEEDASTDDTKASEGVPETRDPYETPGIVNDDARKGDGAPIATGSGDAPNEPVGAEDGQAGTGFAPTDRVTYYLEVPDAALRRRGADASVPVLKVNFLAATDAPGSAAATFRVDSTERRDSLSVVQISVEPEAFGVVRISCEDCTEPLIVVLEGDDEGAMELTVAPRRWPVDKAGSELDRVYVKELLNGRFGNLADLLASKGFKSFGRDVRRFWKKSKNERKEIDKQKKAWEQAIEEMRKERKADCQGVDQILKAVEDCLGSLGVDLDAYVKARDAAPNASVVGVAIAPPVACSDGSPAPCQCDLPEGYWRRAPDKVAALHRYIELADKILQCGINLPVAVAGWFIYDHLYNGVKLPGGGREVTDWLDTGRLPDRCPNPILTARGFVCP